MALGDRLGERVRLMRHRKRYTQARLAAIVDLHCNTVNRLEQGALRGVSAIALAHIAQTLETSTDYLLGLTDKEDPS